MNAPRNNSSYNWLISLFTLQALIKIVSILIIFTLLFFASSGVNVKDKHFDYLIFTHRWLPTACIEYAEKYPGLFQYSHYCTLPKNYTFWAIHGLWPNRYNEIGPFFCNNSMTFDLSRIKPIESDLEVYWPNIEGGKDVASLWEHEWTKHGTCAAQLESLNTEFKYFNTSLNAFKLLKLGSVLNRNNILPSYQGLDVSDLFYVLKKTFGKSPQIHCIFEVKTHQPYLSEIRLCYNKNLELMNCEKISSFNSRLDLASGFTNCPLNQKIIYPDRINPQLNYKPLLQTNRRKDFYDMLIEAFHIIKFLQWVSL